MSEEIPRNDDAERALLASCIYDSQMAEEIMDSLRAEHFFSPLNARIYQAMVNLSDNGLTIEAVAIKTELKKQQHDEGLDLYLTRLMDVPMVANLGYYIDLLTEAHRQRQIISLSEKVREAAMNGVDSTRILGRLQEHIFTIEGNGRHVAPLSFGELVDKSIDGIEAAQKGRVDGIKTGFNRLDRELVSLWPGSLNILCARPGMGKTALALQIGVNAARKGHHVGFFSMEMTADQLALRAACAQAGVEYNKAVAGRLNSDEWALIVEAQGRIRELPIHIDDDPALHITEINRRARRWKRVHNIGLLIADHIQLARSDNSRDRYLMVTEISAGFKAIAKELCIPVLALCQLNREVEKRTDKRPQLSDLRESGAIEQDADTVLGIYRAAYYKPDQTDKDVKNAAEVHIMKQRNGRVCFVKVGWNGESMRFFNLSNVKE